jgi:small-conductance mechanosensitive channel
VRAGLCAIVCVLVTVASATAQQREEPPQSPPAAPVRGDQTATLTYNNRSITVLRARLLHTPAERAAAATYVLETLVAQGITGPVSIQRVDESAIITAGTRQIVVLVPGDVDELVGETLDSKAESAVRSLRQALDEAAELRRPEQLLRASSQALAATVAFLLVLLLLRTARKRVTARVFSVTDRHLEHFPNAEAEVLRKDRLHVHLGRAVTAVIIALGAISAYGWLTFTLRRFPYTRPWGESLREFLFSQASTIGLGMVHALPGLFTAVVILLIARALVRISNSLFDAIGAGRISAPPLWAETALPTKRIVAALIWAFAIIQAYPFIPGSGTDAFAGVSVFVGLIVSLGATGVVNQIISSFMLTYTRALRVGEYVKIGLVEGTVTQLGVLSAKIKTPYREEVTIPNAVILSDVTTNYSRFAEHGGAYVATPVTIGYDVPWRQVHALLLLAAERTEGVRAEPEPQVVQTALEDSHVRYTLLVSLERPDGRIPTLNRLHAHIQDLFNEFDVQIMTPSYEGDPSQPKVVPKARWHAAPARPDGEAAHAG